MVNFHLILAHWIRNGVPIGWKEVISTTGVISLNQWHHVAGTFDGTELKCYVDGNQVGSLLFTGTIRTSTSYPLTIGRLSDIAIGPSRFWNGMLDEIPCMGPCAFAI
jgi:hypothetical protein